MTGFPTETKEEALYNIKKIKEYKAMGLLAKSSIQSVQSGLWF